MPLAVAITGTRSTGHRELGWFADLFDVYLAPFTQEDAHFCIGGAVGIDTLALLWLAKNTKSQITIVAPETVEQQPAAAQQAITAREGQHKHAQAALALAWHDTDRDRRGDPATSSFSPAHLRGFEGIVNLYVGDLSEAHDYFARSSQSLTAPRERVQRAIVSIDQAIARIRLGDARSGAELLHEGIDAVPRQAAESLLCASAVHAAICAHGDVRISSPISTTI